MASLFIGALASLWAAPLRRTSIVRRVNPQASGQAMGKREQMLQNRAHSPETDAAWPRPAAAHCKRLRGQCTNGSLLSGNRLQKRSRALLEHP